MSHLLEKAQEIVNGDRMEDYGHPLDNFMQTAEMWSAQFGRTFTYRDVPLAMIHVKLSRESNKPTIDNLVDIIGYAIALDIADQEFVRRFPVMEQDDDVQPLSFNSGFLDEIDFDISNKFREALISKIGIPEEVIDSTYTDQAREALDRHANYE